MVKIGRNEPCPCGSGKKYKKCCIKKSSKNTYEYKRIVHWNTDEIDDMSTDEIIAQLRAFGIPFDKRQFTLDVVRHNSAIALAKEWQANHLVIAKGFDVDFIWMASIILWQRLTPNRICTEHVDSMIDDAYELESQNIELACDQWLKAWRLIEKQITPDMKTLDDLEKVFKLHLHPISNFVQDLEMYAWNAGLEDETYHHERIKFCEDFCGYFPNESEIIILNMQRAIGDSNFVVGNTEKGEATYEKLIATYPMNAWAYIGWGDIYADATGVAKDLDRAKAIYEMALGKGMKEEADVVDRIENLQNSGYR